MRKVYKHSRQTDSSCSIGAKPTNRNETNPLRSDSQYNLKKIPEPESYALRKSLLVNEVPLLLLLELCFDSFDLFRSDHMASSVAAVVVGAKEEIRLCSKEKTSPNALELRIQTGLYGIIVGDSKV